MCLVFAFFRNFTIILKLNKKYVSRTNGGANASGFNSGRSY